MSATSTNESVVAADFSHRSLRIRDALNERTGVIRSGVVNEALGELGKELAYEILERERTHFVQRAFDCLSPLEDMDQLHWHLLQLINLYHQRLNRNSSSADREFLAKLYDQLALCSQGHIYCTAAQYIYLRGLHQRGNQ